METQYSLHLDGLPSERAEVARVRLASVADSSPEKLGLVQRRFPMVRATADFHDLLRDPEIDAIAVATPVSTHFEFGMAVLKAGKHLWLEKPMTETSLQARQLIDEAAKRKGTRITVTAHPALSLPAGFTPDGLPVGLQLVGRQRGELGLLRLAAAIEQATGVGGRAPDL